MKIDRTDFYEIGWSVRVRNTPRRVQLGQAGMVGRIISVDLRDAIAWYVVQCDDSRITVPEHAVELTIP